MPLPASQPAILLVDDDPVYCEQLATAFTLEGFKDVRTAFSYAAAAREITRRRVDRGVIDMKLDGERTGFHVIRDLRSRWPKARAIILTAYASAEATRLAFQVGACGLLPKTVDVHEILHVLARPDRQFIDISKLEFKPPTLAEVTWRYINQMLDATGGDVKAAAEFLDVSRGLIYRWIDKVPATKWSPAMFAAMGQRPLGWARAARKKQRPQRLSKGTPKKPRH